MIERAQQGLNPKALTIGFARRFATYKRATLFLSDPARLKRILNNPERPVQIIFAGKAHPAIFPDNRLFAPCLKRRWTPTWKAKLYFWKITALTIARMLVQGSDVWLNNPRRPSGSERRHERRKGGTERRVEF